MIWSRDNLNYQLWCWSGQRDGYVWMYVYLFADEGPAWKLSYVNVITYSMNLSAAHQSSLQQIATLSHN